MKIAIYPGSFDPITFGHIDITERACGVFDKVMVSVAESKSKNPLFSVAERIDLAQEIFKDNPKIEVIGYASKLTVDLARENNAIAIIRGLRAVADFEYEFQLAGMNKKLNKNIETIFLMSDIENQIISSKFVKEISKLKGNISQFVTKSVIKSIKEKK